VRQSTHVFIAGVEIVRRLDGEFSCEYLGKSLAEILLPSNLTVEEFVKMYDRFTNKRIFKRDSTGALVRDRNGNLTKISNDTV
jgi:hypothetical protein